MTHPFDFTADGRAVHGALALPAGDAPAGAVILAHEWYGLNDDMRRLADRFAAEGFVALAVDLYDGRVAADTAEAMQLSGAMKTPDAVRIVAAAADALRALPSVNGKVAVTGFCLGGAVAIAAACAVPGLAAAVPFYGTPKAEYVDWSRTDAPLLGHYGRRDPIIPVERPQALADAAKAAGRSFELHFYEAGHAFMREGDAGAYDAPSATLAWERTVAFLRAQLG
ncbi:MAG: Dienelactone hydrolase family [Myxococcaceae bacterium]|nr:Dienelactone hydrolase family [Myxococcaceae bacterium]